MALDNWIASDLALAPPALTVRAQTVPPNDRGNLVWDQFFARDNVDSVDLTDVTTLDYRPTADRREWNARGRRVPLVTPTRRTVSIVPIEANDQVGEKEMQKLAEQTMFGNDRTYQDLIGSRVPARVDRLAQACYRRVEVDSFTAWANGNIVQRNPENAAQTYTASFGFSSSRYTTAGTAWDNVGVNAYTLLLAWIASAQDLVGQIEGAMLRLATFNAILADAPNLPNTVTMTRSALADRVQQDIGVPFEFFINENSVDIFDDGGTAYTRTKIWPTGKIAAVPVGRKVGRVAFAPVARAVQLAREAGPDAGIDVRGVTVFREAANGGRQLNLEAQLNAITIPDEQLLYVTAVGV